LFFFQAEDGIRDKLVTGVQTCALPISVHEVIGTVQTLALKMISQDRKLTVLFETCDAAVAVFVDSEPSLGIECETIGTGLAIFEIGRASCRERVEISVGSGSLEERERG